MYSHVSSSTRCLVVTSALAIAILCSHTKNAQAQTFYTDPNAFHAAVPSPTKYDFEDIAPTGFAINPSLQDITFVVSGGIDPRVYGASPIFGRGTYSLNGSGSVLAGLSGRDDFATTRIGLGHLCTAFAVEVGQSSNNADWYTIRLYRGEQQVGTYCDPGSHKHFFIGITSQIPFDNVRFTTRSQTGGYTLFDNVLVGDLPPGRGRLATR